MSGPSVHNKSKISDVHHFENSKNLPLLSNASTNHHEIWYEMHIEPFNPVDFWNFYSARIRRAMLALQVLY